MFLIFNKDKILSYLISVGTVTLLFIMSFAITKKNDEILKASTNAIYQNNIQNKVVINELVSESESLE